MGQLLHRDLAFTGLRATHVVGRHRGCDLRVRDHAVSSVHAQLRYHPQGWTVRDMESRNGTFVNGTRIDGAVTLREGARLGFGRPDGGWVLHDASPPAPFAVDLLRPDHQVLGRPDLLVLPDPAYALVSVVRDRRRWVLEEGRDARVVEDGEELRIDGAGHWQLQLPPAHGAVTADAEAYVRLGEARIELWTSPDLERFEIDVTHRGGAYRLRHSACHELLWVLAMRPGWMALEDVGRALSLDASVARDRNRLRTWIHRLRQRFQEVGVVDGANIVRREPDTHNVRVGARVRIRAQKPTPPR